MKKALFLLTLVAATSVYAQKHVVPVYDSFLNLKKMPKVNSKIESAPAEDYARIEKSVFTAATEYLEALYARPAGTYHLGVSRDGKPYLPRIMTPAFTTINFKNYTPKATKVSWSANGGSLSSESDGSLNYDIVGVGAYYMPELRVMSSKGSQVSYTYGLTDGIPEDKTLVMGGTVNLKEDLPFTNADVLNGSIYVGSSGKPIFGTGSNSDGTTPKEITSVYQKPASALYVKGADIYFCGMDPDTPMPESEVLALKVYKNDAEGKMTDQILGEATVSIGDIQEAWTYESGEIMFYAPFKFAAPLVINDGYTVSVSGFDKPGFNIGFACSKAPFLYNGVQGSAFFEKDGKMYRKGLFIDEEQTQFVNGYDLCFQLHAVFNCMKVDINSERMFIKPAGGSAYYTIPDDSKEYTGGVLFSSLPFDTENYAKIEGKPDWLEMNMDLSKYEKDRYSIFTFKAGALPAGTETRQAVITFEAMGAKSSVTIFQGANSVSSVEANLVKAARNGGNFELSYVEGMTSLQVIDAAGQTIANYNLNDNGKFVLPGSSLNNGLYILKFIGDKTATIKIVK